MIVFSGLIGLCEIGGEHQRFSGEAFNGGVQPFLYGACIACRWARWTWWKVKACVNGVWRDVIAIKASFLIKAALGNFLPATNFEGDGFFCGCMRIV